MLLSLVVPALRRLARDVAAPRLAARLIGGFRAMALGLSGLGLYGTLACAALERPRELGVRLAPGASPRSPLAQVVREGLRLAGPGSVIGGVIAVTALQAARRVLFGIEATEPLVWSAAIGLTLVVAVIASLAPAWRAASVDPLAALRNE